MAAEAKSPQGNQKDATESFDSSFDRKFSEALQDLQDRIDERIHDQIMGDRAFVKDTIGVAFKIAGAAVALVVIVLGAFSWKTFSDVKSTILETAATETRKQFETPAAKRTIESIVDRAVLDSYVARLARIEISGEADEALTIDDPDAGRLLRIIKDSDIEPDTFASAVNVLGSLIGEYEGAASHKSMPYRIGSTFAQLIAAKDETVRWIETEPERRRVVIREAIKRKISHAAVQQACRELLPEKVEAGLKRAAIEYAGLWGGKDAFAPLVNLATSGDDLRNPALIALANLNPKADIISRWIADTEKQTQPNFDTVATALKSSSALSDSFSDGAIRLVAFVWRYSRLVPFSSTRMVLRPMPPSTGVVLVPSNFLFPKAEGSEDNKGSPVILELLKRYVHNKDLAEFRRFARWISIGRPDPELKQRRLQIRIRVNLEGAAVLQLADGTALNNQTAPGGVVLAPPANATRSDQLLVEWTDPVVHQKKQGEFRGIQHPDNLSFEIVDITTEDKVQGDES